MLFVPLIAAALAAPAAAQPRPQPPIAVVDGWSRATAPRAPGAGYLTIRNRSDRPDRLLSASSPRAERVEVHSMTMAGGVMRMRPLANGLAVPPRGEVRLAPHGNHLMLMGLRQPLQAGEAVPVTLRFERAGPVLVRLAVQPPGADAPRSKKETK